MWFAFTVRDLFTFIIREESSFVYVLNRINGEKN